MREKNKIKIVLSLLVAIAFMLPASSVLGGNTTEKVNAGNTQTKVTRTVGMDQLTAIGPITIGESTMGTLDDNNPCGFPVGITNVSLGGTFIHNGDIFATGTYPIDVQVCKPAWTTCNMIWSTTFDAVQEGGPIASPPDPYFPVDLTVLEVSTRFDANNVYFNFTLPSGVTWPGWSEPIGTIYVVVNSPVLGYRVYTTTLVDPNPNVVYYLGAPIVGSSVIRSGGGWVLPNTILITIPRAGYWSDCCDKKLTWDYEVYAQVNMADYNLHSMMPDFCVGDVYPAEVKKFVEVYKQRLIPGSQYNTTYVNLYCENFETPCEIYANWTTLDMPVWGSNGALDTWTWSGKRSCSPSHSMHNTGFDTYLADQYDILLLGFGGAGINVSKYASINISWCQWIKGDAAGGNIFDYGTFEYRQALGAWTPAGVKYYDSGGNTQTITLTIPVTDNNISFRWIWKSDAAFCYEGWYIDDVCIVGKIGPKQPIPDTYVWDFVMDSHIGPHWINGQCDVEIFPEQWTVTEPGVYKICTWLEALDLCHYSITPYDPYDNPYEDCILINIGNIKDLGVKCADLKVQPQPYAFEGQTVYINGTVCNYGTLNAKDVQVETTIQRGGYFGGYAMNFESGETGGFNAVVNRTAFPDNGYIRSWTNASKYQNDWVRPRAWRNPVDRGFEHVTEYETSSGVRAIASFALENTSQPWRYSQSYNVNDYAMGPWIFDGSMGDLNIACTFDAKFNIGAGEIFEFGVFDEGALGALFGYSLTGYDGPSYLNMTTITFNVSAAIKAALAGGGLVSDPFALGFLMVKNATMNSNPACPWDSKWSGFIIDNVKVTPSYPTGAVVFDQTKVIPFLNASHPPPNCVPIKFVWTPSLVGSYVVTMKVLGGDSNAANDFCVKSYKVINQKIPITDWTCVDYTGTGTPHWVEEGCCGGYFWCGDPATTLYGNSWNDALYLKNATGGINFACTGSTNLSFDTWFNFSAMDKGYVEISQDGGQTWLYVPPIVYSGQSSALPGADAFGWKHAYYVFTAYNPTQIRFRFQSNATGVARGWLVDNIKLVTGSTVLFGPNPCLTFDQFVKTAVKAGCWWQPKWIEGYLNGVYVPDYTGYDFSEYEPSAGVYDPGYYSAYLVKNMSRSQPGAYPNNLDCAIVGKIDVPHSFYGWLQTMIYYDLWEKGDIGYFDVSKDGTTWTTLSSYAGTLSGNADCGFYYYGSHFSLATKSANDLIWWTSLASYFVTQYLSNPQLYVRFRFVSNATQPYAEAGFGYMQGVTFYGMSDNHAPVTTLSMAGTMDPLTHFYTTSVILTLTATDDVTGVKAIYYILDGIQHTYTGPITVSTDGTHTFSYWAVDNEGNIEAAKSIPDFKIDLTGPTVTLTAPTTGALYLFGNHLLDLKSGKTIFLFGGIPVAATASSTDAPITTVQFFADGTLFAEDTTAPYTATFSQKHSGALVLTAKAVDLLGHVATSAPINIDNYIHIGP